MSFGGVSFAFRKRHQSESGVTTLRDLRLSFRNRIPHCAFEKTTSFVRVIECSRDIGTQPAREQYLVPTTEPREIRFGLNSEAVGNFVVIMRVVKLCFGQGNERFPNLVSFSAVEFVRSLQ